MWKWDFGEEIQFHKVDVNINSQGLSRRFFAWSQVEWNTFCFELLDTQSYVLNFHGRVTQASVKNFQVIHENDRKFTFICVFLFYLCTILKT